MRAASERPKHRVFLLDAHFSHVFGGIWISASIKELFVPDFEINFHFQRHRRRCWSRAFDIAQIGGHGAGHWDQLRVRVPAHAPQD
jgi:hypothetical protein